MGLGHLPPHRAGDAAPSVAPHPPTTFSLRTSSLILSTPGGNLVRPLLVTTSIS